MRPFLLLLDLPGKATNFEASLKSIRRLFHASEFLFRFGAGQFAIGFEADAPPEDWRIRDAFGAEVQFLVVELAVPGQFVTDSFGTAAGWFRRHLGAPAHPGPSAPGR